jgi:hypothetical protein
MTLHNAGTSNIKKNTWMWECLLSFPTRMYNTSEMDWSARADWISTSIMPFRDLMLTTPREEFRDLCLSK